VPWWACALVALATVARFGYRQIDFSAKVLAGFVIAEYVVVLALDIAILLKGGHSGIDLRSFSPAAITSGHPFLGLLFCFAAFIGFEATTIYGEEARDPKRTIPLATYAALLLVGGFYSFSLWCLVLGAGSDHVQSFIAGLSDPTNFLYALSDHYLHPAFTSVLRGMFFMSIYAGVIAFHNAAARYMFSMGRERLLPAVLGQTHPVYRSPHIASVLQSVVCALVVVAFAVFGADPVLTVFSLLSNLATLCVLALMVGTAVAIVVYFRRDGHGHGRWRTRWLPGIAAAGLLMVLLLAAANFHLLTGTTGSLSWSLMTLLPLAGIVGWHMARRLQRREPARYAQIGQDHR
jgi:amino acid transporter